MTAAPSFSDTIRAENYHKRQIIGIYVGCEINKDNHKENTCEIKQQRVMKQWYSKLRNSHTGCKPENILHAYRMEDSPSACASRSAWETQKKLLICDLGLAQS